MRKRVAPTDTSSRPGVPPTKPSRSEGARALQPTVRFRSNEGTVMHTRRTFLTTSASAAAILGLSPLRSWAQSATPPATGMLTRTIPSTGEAIPVIGMGTSGSFQVGATAAERDPLREVLRRFFAGGGKL